MSSRDLPVSATLVLGSQEWTNPLGFVVGTGDRNPGPFTHWAIFLAINVSSIHINITQWVLGGGVEKWLSSLECLLLLQRICDWFSAPTSVFYQLPVTPAPGVWPSSGFCGPYTHAHILIHRHACIIKQETSLLKNIDTDCLEKSVTQQSWATLLLSEFVQ